jgi:thiamine biosynthesis lipoprotein
MKAKFFCILCALLLLSGCGENAAVEPVTGTIFAMDTVMELTIYGEQSLLDDAERYIQDLEQKLSVTEPSSEIYQLNQSGTKALSQEPLEILSRALAVCRETQGALDISVYPVVKAWGFTTGSYQVPDQEAIDELLSDVDYNLIQVDGTQVTLGAGMEIDLGSVAKGYAGEQVARQLRDAGVTSALLNLGGNVQTVGSKPDGSPWRVAVQDPNSSDYCGVLQVTDQAVVTSGGYERYFEENGQTYWHILDPGTGYPARSGLISVTVIGDDGLRCDALSTALFVMGLDRAVAFWRSSGDFEFVLITEDGSLYVSEGADFTALGDYADAALTVITHEE